MEVMIPVPAMDFDFNSARSSPYPTAPSTPKRFGEYYFSAPNSPARISEFYQTFDWEEKLNKPRSTRLNTKYDNDFAFDLGEESKRASLSADELFDGGKIRPLKPPPTTRRSPVRSARSNSKKTEHERGRERVPDLSSSSSSHRAARSLSPFRVSEYPWEEEDQQKQSSIIPKASNTLSSSSSSKGCRKWRLKDLFLFRSASEGRAADKDPFKTYATLFKKHQDIKNGSLRSLEGSNSKRRGPAASAHELHYTVNRAVSEDLKKKTFLPYKQGILGRLAFNPAVHALANGFGVLFSLIFTSIIAHQCTEQ
ncbi:hypothetical protein F0562_035923 [Nyssa sinensis]|uniref:Uncharacterized protein n=1 Tax=Nyssa sinensis TaxID=561372 RepID=A0A5J5AEE2_9ASTE|nr:hypothetical protein F0562_035923 [Nyssa sinensis]